jgi:hypothetical protein
MPQQAQALSPIPEPMGSPALDCKIKEMMLKYAQ